MVMRMRLHTSKSKSITAILTIIFVIHACRANNYEYVSQGEVQIAALSNNFSCCNSMALEQTASSASCSPTADIEMVENVSCDKQVELQRNICYSSTKEDPFEE